VIARDLFLMSVVALFALAGAAAAWLDRARGDGPDEGE
jgi:hypothetical protein